MKKSDKSNRKNLTQSRSGGASACILKGLKGFTIALIMAAAGILISGLMLLFTAMGIDSSTGLIMVFITAGAFINGFTAAAAVGKKGLIAGFAVGLLYVGVLTAFFALVVGTGAPSSGRAALLAIPVAASAAAGVLGVGRN